MTHEAWSNEWRGAAEIKSDWAPSHSDELQLLRSVLDLNLSIPFLFSDHLESTSSFFYFDSSHSGIIFLTKACQAQILPGCGLASQTSSPMKPLSRWLWKVGLLESSTVLSSSSSSLTSLGECLLGLGQYWNLSGWIKHHNTNMYFKGFAVQCSGLVVTLGRFNSSLYYFIFYYLYKATVVLVKYIVHVLHKTSLLLGKVTHSLSCKRKLKKHT